MVTEGRSLDTCTTYLSFPIYRNFPPRLKSLWSMILLRGGFCLSMFIGTDHFMCGLLHWLLSSSLEYGAGPADRDEVKLALDSATY